MENIIFKEGNRQLALVPNELNLIGEVFVWPLAGQSFPTLSIRLYFFPVAALAYAIYISLLILYSRACDSPSCFH